MKAVAAKQLQENLTSSLKGWKFLKLHCVRKRLNAQTIFCVSMFFQSICAQGEPGFQSTRSVCASENRENLLLLQNWRVKLPPEALLTVTVRSSKKSVHAFSRWVRMHGAQATETRHPAKPGPSVSEQGGRHHHHAACGPAQKHNLIQEANSPGSRQADTQPLTRSVAQRQQWADRTPPPL